MLGGQEPSEPRSPRHETEGRPAGRPGRGRGLPLGSRPEGEGFKFGPSHSPSFRRLRLPSLCLRGLLAVSPDPHLWPAASGGRPPPCPPPSSFSGLRPPPPRRGSTTNPDEHPSLSALSPTPEPCNGERRELPGHCRAPRTHGVGSARPQPCLAWAARGWRGEGSV